MLRVEVARRKPWFLQGEGQRTGRTHPGLPSSTVWTCPASPAPSAISGCLDRQRNGAGPTSSGPAVMCPSCRPTRSPTTVLPTESRLQVVVAPVTGCTRGTGASTALNASLTRTAMDLRARVDASWWTPPSSTASSVSATRAGSVNSVSVQTSLMVQSAHGIRLCLPRRRLAGVRCTGECRTASWR